MSLSLTKRMPRVILVDIGGKGRIGRFGDSPWQFLELHAVEDNSSSPNINESCIVFCMSVLSHLRSFDELTFLLEQLWRNVGFRTTQSFTQMRLLFPAHSEYIGNAKIGDFDMSASIQQ